MKVLKRWAGYVLVLLALTFGVFFSIQNQVRVPLDLLVLPLPEAPLAVWVLGAFIVGGLVGVLVCSVALLRQKSHITLLRRRLNRSNKEIDKLRTTDLRSALPNGASSGQKNR